MFILKGFLQKYLFSHKSFSISHCIFRSNARIWRISCKIGTARVPHALSQSCQSWCMIFIILNLKSTSRDCRSDLVDMIFPLPWKLPLWYDQPYLKSPIRRHFQSKLPICNVYTLDSCKGLLILSFLTELEKHPNKEQCRSDRLPFQMFQNNGLLRALPWYLIYLQILGPKFRINQQKLPNFSGERSYLGHYSAGIMNFAEFWSLPLRVNQFYFFRQLVEWFATTNILPSITSPSWKEITLWNIAFLYSGVS